MKQLSAAAVTAAMLAGATMGAMAADHSPIVVELYTSQGCSSCPPADALLGRLARRGDVIALSLPITYWDMLGWKDTLASDANTRRQNAYAASMGHGGVYTPQMVVGGVKDVVGSREEDVDDAIDDAIEARDEADDAVEDAGDQISLPGGLTSVASVGHGRGAAAWSVGVTLSSKAERLHLAVAAAPAAVRKAKLDATIWLMRVRSGATVRIAAGENGGRTMTYRNVVSDIRDAGHWRGTPLSLDLPRADAKTPPHDGVVAIVQQNAYGRIIGAAYIARSPYYAQE